MTSIAISLRQHHPRVSLVVAALVAIAIHLLLLLVSRDFSLFAPQLSAPIQVREIDPRELERTREQWRKRSLLLQKEKTAPIDAPAPEDARYFSDRNRAVEEERRARNTAPLPSQARPSERTHAVPKLSQLGVRLPQPAERSQPGGDQAISDPRLKEGDTNLLNTVESVYYSYYSRLYEAIAPLWNSRIRAATAAARGLPEGEYTARAEIVFDSEGNLRDILIVQSSGVAAFDEAIHHAWRRIQRFPNPPRDLLDANREVRTGWTFTVTLDPRAGFQYWEPERAY